MKPRIRNGVWRGKSGRSISSNRFWHHFGPLNYGWLRLSSKQNTQVFLKLAHILVPLKCSACWVGRAHSIPLPFGFSRRLFCTCVLVAVYIMVLYVMTVCILISFISLAPFNVLVLPPKSCCLFLSLRPITRKGCRLVHGQIPSRCYKRCPSQL